MLLMKTGKSESKPETGNEEQVQPDQPKEIITSPQLTMVSPEISSLSTTFKPYPNRARRWRNVPTQVRKRGTVLFDQQMWCWGQDIRRQEGNALVSYGFVRHRPIELEGKASVYSLEGLIDCRVMLGGFGMFYAEGYPEQKQAGLFLGRFDFIPKLTYSSEVKPEEWKPGRLPWLHLPSTASDWARVRQLLPAALKWIIDYENWALHSLGYSYREACVAKWLRPVMSPQAALLEWEWLMQQSCLLGLE